MRRPLFALVWLSLVITVLVGLKSAPAAQMLGWSAESPVGPDGLTDGGAGGDGGTGGATPDPSAQPSGSSAAAAPNGSAGPTTSTAGAPGATTSTSRAPGATTTSSSAPPPAGGVSGTFTGAAINVKTAQSPTVKSSSCGDCASYTIAVTITVANGKITATSVAYNPSPGGSLSYASQANNALKSSILTKQTWNLGKVSGATYAGNAWELSVKDAMTKAGLPV